MSFNIFKAGLRIDPDQINDNFSYLFVGDRLPYSGVSLSATNNVYNLGSTEYTWNNVYCETLDVDFTLQNDGENMQGILRLQFKTTITTATNRIEITDLDLVDETKFYQVLIHVKQNNDNLSYYMSFDGDTATSLEYIVATFNPSARDITSTTLGAPIGRKNNTGTSDINVYTDLKLSKKLCNWENSSMNTALDFQSQVFGGGDIIQSFTSLVLHVDTTTAFFGTGTVIEFYKGHDI